MQKLQKKYQKFHLAGKKFRQKADFGPNAVLGFHIKISLSFGICRSTAEIPKKIL